jgi:hypothetical protein
MFDAGEKDWLQSYIRPRLQTGFQSAGPDGIRRGRPHLLGALEGLATIQASLPRGPTNHAINRTSTCATFSDPRSFGSLIVYAACAA